MIDPLLSVSSTIPWDTIREININSDQLRINENVSKDYPSLQSISFHLPFDLSEIFILRDNFMTMKIV